MYTDVQTFDVMECKILGCTGLVSACIYTQVIREKKKKTQGSKRDQRCASRM